MISPRFLVGVTGHRHLADPLAIAEALGRALLLLRDRARLANGDIELFTSIALGADTLAVEQARSLGLRVHIVLPKPVETDDKSGAPEINEGFAADFWETKPDGSRVFLQADWDRALKQILDAKNGIDGGTLRMVRGSQSDPECYYDAGVQMLDTCDAVIAVWDGKAARGLGGTAEIVSHARASKPVKSMILIDAATAELRPENLDAFASSSELQLREIVALNELCPRGTHAAGAGAVFSALDHTANEAAKQFRSTVVRGIFLHGTATIIAAFAAILPKSIPWINSILVALASIELVLVTYAWWLWRLHTTRHTHERWLRARFGAELVRGLIAGAAFLDPLTPHVLRHAPRWRRFAITLGLLAVREVDRSQTWQQHRETYAKRRIDDQLVHFARKQKAAAAVLHRTQWIAAWATKVAPFFVLFALTVKCWHLIEAQLHPEDHQGAPTFSWTDFTWTLFAAFFPILIPLVASIASGLRAALDATRRTHRYGEIAERLEATSQGLRLLQTESSARRVIVATEEVLLDELIEWHLAEKQNGGH